MFGLTTEQVLNSRGWYNPHWHYENEPETRAALDLIFDNHFSPDEQGFSSRSADSVDEGRLLHAPCGPDRICGNTAEGRHDLRRPFVGNQGDLQHRPIREILERSDDCQYAKDIWGRSRVRCRERAEGDRHPGAGVRRLFTEGFLAADIAESLTSFDGETPVAVVAKLMDIEGFDVVGVRRKGLVAGFVERAVLSGGLCDAAMKEFTAGEVLPDSAPLLNVVQVLAGGPRAFVTAFGQVAGIVTRDDIQKPAVRMWLFGIVTMIEMRYTRLIQEICSEGSWRQHLSEGRLKKAEEFMAERQRRGRSAELLDCLQLSDKGRIVARDERIRSRTIFASRRQAEDGISLLEGLRNDLAHAQDIVSSDWDAIVQLSAHLHRLLEEATNVMNWEQRYRLRHHARTSLVLWASWRLVAALAFAMIVRWVAHVTGWKVFELGPEGASPSGRILWGRCSRSLFSRFQRRSSSYNWRAASRARA